MTGERGKLRVLEAEAANTPIKTLRRSTFGIGYSLDCRLRLGNISTLLLGQ
jgi:hypothetical protein